MVRELFVRVRRRSGTGTEGAETAGEETVGTETVWQPLMEPSPLAERNVFA
jgi:hypothetical protein